MAQLTIRIGFDSTAADIEDKMAAYQQKRPFDKRKISAAVLLLLGCVYGVGSLLVYVPVIITTEEVHQLAVVESQPKPVKVAVVDVPPLQAKSELVKPLVQTPVEPEKSLPDPVDVKELVKESVKEPIKTVTVTTSVSKLVNRAVLTSGVNQLEPIDDLGNSVSANGQDSHRVFFFTELESLNGQTVYHRWLFEGKQVFQLSLSVGSDRWRTYSSKAVWAGDWAVEVLDAKHVVLASYAFAFKL